MKTLIALSLAATAALAARPALAETQIGVSIGINAPGQYGRIDINNYPNPVLISPRPVIYAPPAVAVYQQPIYLYVSAGHQANWGRYCNEYRACGQPVYFVREDWVREEYGREHGHSHKNKDKGRDGDGKKNGNKNNRDRGHEGRGN